MAKTTITSTDTAAFTVAASGTNYGLQVDESSSSAATGLKVKAGAAGSGLALSVISSGANESLTVDAIGSGTVTIGSASTGNVKIGSGPAIDVAASDGNTTFTSTNVSNAWKMNSTGSSAGYLEIQRSGSARLRIGHAENILAQDANVINSYQKLYLRANDNNNQTLELQGTSFTTTSDNVLSLGEIGRRWTAVYAVNGTIQTSDLRQKDVIGDSLGLEFVNALRPIAFRWKQDDGKVRYGLGAQDVVEVAPEGAFVQGDQASSFGMNYSEFVAPLVKAVQELSAQLQDAGRSIDLLTQRVQRLEVTTRTNSQLTRLYGEGECHVQRS
jgi:hypothetical protein